MDLKKAMIDSLDQLDDDSIEELVEAAHAEMRRRKAVLILAGLGEDTEAKRFIAMLENNLAYTKKPSRAKFDGLYQWAVDTNVIGNVVVALTFGLDNIMFVFSGENGKFELHRAVHAKNTNEQE